MFAALGIAILASARKARSSDKDERNYELFYYAIVGLMFLSGLIINIIVPALNVEWDHQVMVLEAVEISLFAAFWLAKTRQQWNEDVRAEELRAEGQLS